MKIGPEYRREHVLADGTRILVRTIRPSDAPALREAFHRLSPSSKYRRFFGGVTELSDEMLAYLTNVDGVSHFAIVATLESNDLKSESGIGVARFVRLEGEPSVAEAAVTVVDEMQSKGVARILLATLAIAATERGVERFRGAILASNAPVRAILAEVGAVLHREDATTLVFDVALGEPQPEPDRPSSPALSRLLREAASSMAILARNLRPPS
jgi:hypothetical protein